jgi:hypothetical protein
VEDADQATRRDAKQREVSASLPDIDEAIFAAYKAAKAAGDTKRARALLDLLDAEQKPAPVLRLTRSKPR